MEANSNSKNVNGEQIVDVGSVVEAVSADAGDAPLYTLESLCMNCRNNGTTRFLLTLIPNFRKILLSAFECPHCGERNNEVQFAGEIQPRGCCYTLEFPAGGEQKMFNRQVVKSESATIKIPELDFEIPPEAQRGSLSTVEGILMRAADELQALQEERRKVAPETAEAIDQFLVKLRACATGESSFTLVLDDPAGNSFIENPFAPSSDPSMTIKYYERTPEQQAFLGYLVDSTQTEGRGEALEGGKQQHWGGGCYTQNMEVQVAVPVPVPADFNFDSNCSSPYITAPSSPQRFGNLFFSAPTSPTRISPLFEQSSAPLHCQQTPDHNHHDDDFAFDFSGNLETTSLSAADELFHAGKIRPLKPPSPPRLQPYNGTISPRKRISPEIEEKRGRERVLSSGRKGSRSLSPLRVSDIAFESEDNKDVSSSSSNSKSFLSFTKKWRLRNFLLFRSASEGRATENDPLRKYTALSKKDDDVRNCSFRSSDSGSVSKRRGPVSAHELHYTLNRAASEELKKRTLLPYKQGLLGCLGFNRDMHRISKGIGSLPRS